MDSVHLVGNTLSGTTLPLGLVGQGLSLSTGIVGDTLGRTLLLSRNLVWSCGLRSGSRRMLLLSYTSGNR
jgi:hypothetical protein